MPIPLVYLAAIGAGAWLVKKRNDDAKAAAIGAAASPTPVGNGDIVTSQPGDPTNAPGQEVLDRIEAIPPPTPKAAPVLFDVQVPTKSIGSIAAPNVVASAVTPEALNAVAPGATSYGPYDLSNVPADSPLGAYSNAVAGAYYGTAPTTTAPAVKGALPPDYQYDTGTVIIGTRESLITTLSGVKK